MSRDPPASRDPPVRGGPAWTVTDFARAITVVATPPADDEGIVYNIKRRREWAMALIAAYGALERDPAAPHDARLRVMLDLASRTHSTRQALAWM